jgi:hypothetical protein
MEAVNMIEPGSWPATDVNQVDFPFSDAYLPIDSEPINRALAKAIWLPDKALQNRLFLLLESSDWVDRRGSVSALDGPISQASQVFEILQRLVAADDNEQVRYEAVRAVARSFAERPETFELLRKRAQEDDSEKIRRAAVRALAHNFAEQSKTLEILKNWTRHGVSSAVRRAATYDWAQPLGSLLSRRLLTRDLDDLDPGIDLSEVIDSSRIEEAAAKLNEHPDTIREHYEQLVRDHGFPLRLSWLENEEEGNPPPNPE